MIQDQGKLIKGLVISCLLVFQGANIFAQSEPVAASIRAEISIPYAISNKAFKKSFTGVYDVNLSPVFNISKGLFIGPSARLTKFKVSLPTILELKTTWNTQSAGVRLGYEYFISEYSSITGSINSGYSWIEYKKVGCADYDRFKRESFFLTPSVQYNFLADENFAIGAGVSYSNMENVFNPDEICLQGKEIYFPEEYNGKTSFFSFGFSMSYYFVKGGKTIGPKERVEEGDN